MSNYKIPFNKASGSLINYMPPINSSSVEWRDNYVFTDALEFVGYEKGRSAFNLIFQDTKGSRYHMFLKESIRIIPLLVYGKIIGNWTFVKRGANYGIIMV